MTRRYGHPIVVRCAEDGRPSTVRWRATEHRVRGVLSEWELRDRWWERSEIDAAATARASERHYYRLDCETGLLCDVYYDAVIGHWILDVVLD